MIRIKEFFKPFYHKCVRLSKWKRRIGLHCTDFTIISNNCTGGYVYQYFGLPYKTPTEGLYFTTRDYIKLIERPEYYFRQNVLLIAPQKSTLAQKGKDIHYPVGLLDDIEIYFMHYPDPQEAINKWRRRVSRMNFSKLFFLLTETELSTEDDIKQFSSIISSKTQHTNTHNGVGICLMLSNRKLPYTLYVPNVPKNFSNGNAAWKPEIIIKTLDWIRILNNL